MGFRSDWAEATAAANNPNDQLHDAGVAYVNAVNDYVASTDQGNYDISNKTTPQKPQSFGYYKEANKLADYTIERGQNNGGGDNSPYTPATSGNNNNAGGSVYGSQRYGGVPERPNTTGTEWTQPGTGFGTGSFLGMALEDLNAQNQSATPPTSTIYGGKNVMVPDGGFKSSNSAGTEWNQPGTGFGTGNFAGNYAELIDLMRNGNSLEEAQAIVNNRNDLTTMQDNNVTLPQPPAAPSRLDNDSLRAFKDYQVAAGPSGSNTRTREPEWVPVESEVNTNQPIDVWAYNRAVADRQRGLNIDQILLEAEAEGSPQSMQYYNWIVNHMR